MFTCVLFAIPNEICWNSWFDGVHLVNKIFKAKKTENKKMKRNMKTLWNHLKLQFLERGLHFLYGILHRLANFSRGKILSTLKVILVTLFLKIGILKSKSICV